MDLLSIARKLWRHRVLTAVIAALTFGLALYVVAIKAPVYEATSSLVLINPPAPPTDEEIARDPALESVNADNPFTRFSDQSTVVEVVATAVSTDEARKALADKGADDRYTVERSSEFGFSSPIVEITGVGSSEASAIATADVVSRKVVTELDEIQADRGIDSTYRIDALQVEAPAEAELRATGKLRTLVAVLALGTLALFVGISIAEALRRLPSRRPAAGWLSLLEEDDDGTPPSRPRTNGHGSFRRKLGPPPEHDRPAGASTRAPELPRSSEGGTHFSQRGPGE